MTNKEILDVFTERYPNVSVNDYRPIADVYMPKGRQGITIWTDTNDVILFFPYTDGADDCPLHEVTADTDTISRQDAIDLIERYCDNACEIAEDKWCPDCQQSKFAEMIKALPPSPRRPQWIPVTERLPEECGNYFVSGGNEVWICEWTKSTTLSGWVNSVRNPVIESWMPLPEPYRP